MSVKTPDISFDKIVDYCRALKNDMLNKIMINKTNSSNIVDQLKYSQSCKQ